MNMEQQSAKRRKIDAPQHQIDSTAIHPETSWNEEMKAFYNDPWGWEYEMDAMNEQPVQWSELCYSPKMQTKCIMCGMDDHTKTSCPNSCCLKCGGKTVSFQDECANCAAWSSAICEICGCRGHMKKDCPNHWKCHHSTINTVSPPDSMLENLHQFEFNWDSSERRDGFYGGC